MEIEWNFPPRPPVCKICFQPAWVNVISVDGKFSGDFCTFCNKFTELVAEPESIRLKRRLAMIEYMNKFLTDPTFLDFELSKIRINNQDEPV